MFYALRSAGGLHLVDTGFLGGAAALRRALGRCGWQHLPLLGIFLTHWHIDHAWNAVDLARRHGAWVCGPPADAAGFSGKLKGSGWGRLGAGMQALCAGLLGVRPFRVDREATPGGRFDEGRGLRVVALPGHTPGHIGYFCEERRLLFCGDLFASHHRLSHRPPAVFNHDSAEAARSLVAALDLDPVGVLPHHCDGASPEEHPRRLRRLAGRPD